MSDIETGWFKHKDNKTHYFVQNMSGMTPYVSLCQGYSEIDDLSKPEMDNLCGNCKKSLSTKSWYK